MNVNSQGLVALQYRLQCTARGGVGTEAPSLIALAQVLPDPTRLFGQKC